MCVRNSTLRRCDRLLEVSGCLLAQQMPNGSLRLRSDFCRGDGLFSKCDFRGDFVRRPSVLGDFEAI